jgi:acetyltransferase-like isoleucine patch superfamily enzyme
VIIADHVWLNARDLAGDGSQTLAIGDDSYIGRYSQINACKAVTIGKSVLIADRVFISDSEHNFNDTATPIRWQGESFTGAVHLEDGCWIGIGAVILGGVTVGKNAIVGANSVVTKNVQANSVVGGAPARLIRQLG